MPPATRVEGVFVVSILASAGLLFLVQPMLARMLLASFGGSPAVWSTCLVFFQLLLLAGYAYAHGTVHLLGPRRQMTLHAAVLLASLLFLPQMLRPHAVSAPWPALSVLLTLAAMAAIPFAVLSTNSSLTQRWFGGATFRSSNNPFWLYAASNAGSLVALLGYPLVVEPLVGLRSQLVLWSAGYIAFVALSLATMYLAIRHARVPDAIASSADALAATPALTRTRRASWVVRSAVASSLLLGISMEISTDVLAAPLLWVVPLALYLVTFIVAFSPARPRRGIVSRATMVGIALCLGVVVLPTVLPLWFALLTMLGTLFAGALLCHGDLADDRPPVAQLTSFYLWIAVGGAVGGLLNSLVAPLVFGSVAEYPITLACLALLLPARDAWRARAEWRRALVSPAALAMLVAMALATVFVLLGRRHAVAASDDSILRWQFMPVAVLLAGLLLGARPFVFPLATALAGLFVIAGLHFTDPIIDQGRSFFGVSRVTENATE